MAASRRPLHRLLSSLALAAWLAFASHAACAAPSAPPPAQRFVRDGVAVEFSLLPAGEPSSVAPSAGETARVRFAITDTTSGKPLTRLHPAAWFSRQASGSNELRPRTAAERVQELLGGSIFSRADLDLNSFRVLALNDDATITVVDPLFGFGGTKLLAMVALPGVGRDWALTSDASRLLVSLPATGQIVTIDTATWQAAPPLVLGAAPGRIALQPDGHYAWVAYSIGQSDALSGVAVLSADGTEIVARIPTGPGPHQLAFSADSRWAFVANSTARTLSVIDIRTLKKTKDLALDCAPVALAYSRLSEALYLTDEANGKIVVVDAVKHEIVKRLAAEPGVREIRFAPGDRFGLVAAPERNLVLVLDASTNRIVQRARIEDAPDQFAFSSDMVFVVRRGSSTVSMIPFKELGREGQPVAVAEFAGGEAPFGPRSSLGDYIVPAVGDNAVVVANPTDKAIYYYMEGMAAPMGNFSNYDRRPRATLVIDRSLREVAPGIYETAATLPAAGGYDVVFFLESPRVTHLFSAQIPARPGSAAGASGPLARLEVIPSPANALVAGQPARVAFRLRGATPTVTAPTDLIVRTMLAPGVWHSRLTPTFTSEGDCVVEFTPPNAGIYYFYAESASLGLASGQPPCLVLRATEPASAAAK